MKRLLVLAVLCVQTAIAHAQTSTLPDGSTLDFVRIYLQDNTGNLVQPTQTMPNDQLNGQPYFNYARCVCSDPAVPHSSDFKETGFGYLLQLQNVTSPSELAFPLQIWVGAQCDQLGTNPTLANANCHRIANAGVSNTATIQTTNGITPVIPVYDLMMPEGSARANGATPACGQRVLAANEWAIASTDNTTPNFFVSQEINTDSLPPPTPIDITATSGESQIELSWKAVIGNTADIAYYQALCIDPSGSAVSSSPPAPRYITPQTLCGATGSDGSAGSDVNATLVACNFTDPANPDECTASPTQITPTDAGVPDAAIDAGSGSAFVAPIVDAGTGVDAPPDAAVPINLAPLQQLPSAFICGENVTSAASATSLTITGLTDGVPYTVVLLTIDLYGNAAGVYINKTLVPKPVTDFWQDLHDKGGQAKGGFCLIAETYGDQNPLTNTLRRFRDHTLADTVLGRALIHAYYASVAKLGAVVHGHWALRIVSGVLLLPFVLIALLWHWLTLPGLALIVVLLWLRRRVIRSRALAKLATAGAALLVLGMPARAHAQAPYWVNQETGSDETTLGFAEVEQKPKWHVGIKLGPYTPDIDSQSTMTNSAGQGPYKAMFGGAQVMPELDFDRFLWSGFGQVGVGISVAYMQKSAHPFVIPSDPNDPDRPRSSGDTTAFHLLPIAVTAVYRFSWLDDEYGIPIVPYVRGGVGYYVWWSTINGHVSSNTMGFGKADGASAGLVGAAGIAIRAERIDATAARAMHESGIAHAGFYGEVNAGWVDGFGKSTKLDVGALTWFAGIEMEF